METQKLEKKIDSMVDEMKVLHNELISLRTEVKLYSGVNAKHDTDLELLKSKIHEQNGIIGLFKIVGVVLLSSFIAFATWITSSVYENQKRLEKHQESIEHIAKDVAGLENVIFKK